MGAVAGLWVNALSATRSASGPGGAHTRGYASVILQAAALSAQPRHLCTHTQASATQLERTTYIQPIHCRYTQQVCSSYTPRLRLLLSTISGGEEG